MIILFDLDYTLMDTARLHDRLAEIFDREDYRHDYQALFKQRQVNFDAEKYLKILKQQGRVDAAREKELRRGLNELMNELDKYLKPGAAEALQHFKQAGDRLVLITFGNQAWQAEKVKYLSIAGYFDQVIFEERDKSKSDFLKSLGQAKEKALIVNDNIGEAAEMKKILGERAELRLVKGKYNQGTEPDIENLIELTEKYEARI
ncbi:MAG: HAD hydrolase-like protein [bacterium]|nr:HAD hydrolase-like protein [bacterium]